jgi:hypothetical protein
LVPSADETTDFQGVFGAEETIQFVPPSMDLRIWPFVDEMDVAPISLSPSAEQATAAQ